MATEATANLQIPGGLGRVICHPRRVSGKAGRVQVSDPLQDQVVSRDEPGLMVAGPASDGNNGGGFGNDGDGHGDGNDGKSKDADDGDDGSDNGSDDSNVQIITGE